MRRLLITAMAIAAVVGAAGGALAKPKATHLDLPDGLRPEGIASAGGHDFFVGSIPTGAVLRLDGKTGETSPAVPARPDHAAIGLKADSAERLFVAGGPTGKAFVYDASNGAELAAFQLAPAGAATFVNDVVLSRGNAYFTDSRRAVLYVVATDLSGFKELPLTGFTLAAGNNLNGIAATSNGKWLLAVQSNTGALWRIDPNSGAAKQIDLGGTAVTNGDGLLRVGRTLYVVENRDNHITEIRLGKRYDTGRVTGTLTSPDFDVPTTIARHGSRLYAVNARFGTAMPDSADYWVTVLKR